MIISTLNVSLNETKVNHELFQINAEKNLQQLQK